MPNAIVPAAAGGMPKFDQASIMREAWALYRRDTAGLRLKLSKDRRKWFARCLRTAWAWAKDRIAEAAKSLQQRAADRVQELTVELMRIDARPWKMATTADRRAVQAELEVLRTIAAH